MTITYQISGMSCVKCQAKVQNLLSEVKGVKTVNVDLTRGEANITIESHINIDELQLALKNHPEYQLMKKQ